MPNKELGKAGKRSAVCVFVTDVMLMRLGNYYCNALLKQEALRKLLQLKNGCAKGWQIAPLLFVASMYPESWKVFQD